MARGDDFPKLEERTVCIIFCGVVVVLSVAVGFIRYYSSFYKGVIEVYGFYIEFTH